jgi:hypothetical protein
MVQNKQTPSHCSTIDLQTKGWLLVVHAFTIMTVHNKLTTQLIWCDQVQSRQAECILVQACIETYLRQ